MKSIPEKILRGMTREAPIETLFHGTPDEAQGGERTLLNLFLPPWQRPEVWSVDRKKAFVEGIFLGLGTGFYVVHQLDWAPGGARKPMSGWLLDGQQRITALRDFAENEFSIFDGVFYRDLDQSTLRRRFLHVVFPYVELTYQNDEQRLREIYQRMNFGGVAHTQADFDRVDAAPLQRTVELANAFNRHLLEAIGEENFREVVARNAAEKNPNLCHSHDFCDANMVMADAWKEAEGKEVDLAIPYAQELWGLAWDQAKASMETLLDSQSVQRPREN